LEGDVRSVGGENLTLNNMTNASATIGDAMIEPATGGNVIDVQVHGTDTLNTLQGPGWPGNAPIAIEEAKTASLTGTFLLGTNNNEPITLTLTGASGSSFHNLNSIAQSPGLMFINTDVVGAGDFDINGGRLEFGKSVDTDQDVRVGANGAGGLLQIDQPTLFHGLTELFNSGAINLMSLATADSYAYSNDILSLYAGNTLIDTLNLHDSTTYGFVVEPPTAGGSISIMAITDPNNVPVGLPLHTSV
jgi:hypothetical protein